MPPEKWLAHMEFFFPEHPWEGGGGLEGMKNWTSNRNFFIIKKTYDTFYLNINFCSPKNH